MVLYVIHAQVAVIWDRDAFIKTATRLNTIWYENAFLPRIVCARGLLRDERSVDVIFSLNRFICFIFWDCTWISMRPYWSGIEKSIRMRNSRIVAIRFEWSTAVFLNETFGGQSFDRSVKAWPATFSFMKPKWIFSMHCILYLPSDPLKGRP